MPWVGLDCAHVKGCRHSLTDVLLQVDRTVLPASRSLRKMIWAGDLNSDQVQLMAVHAYGALRVVEELEPGLMHPENYM